MPFSTSLRMRETAWCFDDRSQRWRWFIRKSVPCSFGEIGYSPAAPRISNVSTPSSTPPGARSSARTVPMTRTDDSCVTSSAAFHVSSLTSFLKTTHCRYPLPSRTIGNCSFPEVRLLYSHPSMVTFSPMCWGSSLMRVVVIRGGDYMRLRNRAQRHPSRDLLPTRGCAAGHRQECLCHICPSVLAGVWSLAGPNVAQTLLSVPGPEPPLRACSLPSIPLVVCEMRVRIWLP